MTDFFWIIYIKYSEAWLKQTSGYTKHVLSIFSVPNPSFLN
jgi:hypothetical protein